MGGGGVIATALNGDEEDNKASSSRTEWPLPQLQNYVFKEV